MALSLRLAIQDARTIFYFLYQYIILIQYLWGKNENEPSSVGPGLQSSTTQISNSFGWKAFLPSRKTAPCKAVLHNDPETDLPSIHFIPAASSGSVHAHHRLRPHTAPRPFHIT